jgi:hypothetical protein
MFLHWISQVCNIADQGHQRVVLGNGVESGDGGRQHRRVEEVVVAVTVMMKGR